MRALRGRRSSFPRGAGRRLAQVREALGVSQDDLGRILQVSQKAVSAYEREAIRPSGDVIERLRRAVEPAFISFNWVLTGEPPMFLPRILDAASERVRRTLGRVNVPSQTALLLLLERLPDDLVTDFLLAITRNFPRATLVGSDRLRALVRRLPTTGGESVATWFLRSLAGFAQRELAVRQAREEEPWFETYVLSRPAVALALRRAALIMYGRNLEQHLPLFAEAADAIRDRAKLIARALPGGADPVPDDLLTDPEKVLSFCEHYGVSPVWLLVGQGERSLWSHLAEADPEGHPMVTSSLVFGHGELEPLAIRVSMTAVAERLARELLRYPVDEPGGADQARAYLEAELSRYDELTRPHRERLRQEAAGVLGREVPEISLAPNLLYHLEILLRTGESEARDRTQAVSKLVGLRLAEEYVTWQRPPPAL